MIDDRLAILDWRSRMAVVLSFLVFRQSGMGEYLGWQSIERQIFIRIVVARMLIVMTKKAIAVCFIESIASSMNDR